MDSTSAGPPPAGSIVVGIDGSLGSDLAFDWAVRQAVLEHRPLTVLHAAHLTMSGNAGLAGMPGVDLGPILDELQDAGRLLLADAVRRARLLDPAVDVHTLLSNDDPRAALLRLAEHAATVVVGSRGRGPMTSLLLGSVSVTVSKHSVCPVVVVRHDRAADLGQGVVVGVDGTEASLPAVEFAYRLASVRSLALTVMHVFWSDPGLLDRDPLHDDHVVGDEEPGLEKQRGLLSDSVAGMGEKFPDVDAHLSLIRGYRDVQLIAASRSADLLVVGTRHRGLVDRVIRGAVAASLVEHALCDVAVVPAGDVVSS